jgi:protein-S-isoprenylcysteine O-methyltransferase Ste14
MPISGTRRDATVAVIAWMGGALFVLSLLWFLYSYLVRFDTLIAHRSAGEAITLNVALFSIFAVHHSVLARSGAKRLVRRVAPPELERSLYSWVASALLIVVCTYWQHLPGALYRLHGAWRIAGYLVQLVGLVVTARASAALGVLDLAGIRQVREAQRGMAARHVALEMTGLYGFVRHPLYFAWTLMMFGAPDMTATRATFAIVSTLYLTLAIPWEERALVQVFGADYERYQKKVRWRMVPGLY